MSRGRSSGVQQKKQPQTRNFYIGLGIVLLLAIAGGAYTYLTRAPEVSATRLDLEPFVGEEDASVTVYEFGAYGCTSCRTVHQSGFNERLNQLIESDDYQGQVRFVFVNFPIINPSIDPHSAEAAQCALDQGQEAFWLFHDGLFEMSNAQYTQMRDDADFVDLANSVGIDSGQIEKCLANKTHARTVDHHEQRARDRFVTGTPTFFVNDQRVGTDLIQIENAIRAELARS